jgi:1-acyl-sn-glycerol-3-phosphate acyltransferase
MRCLRLVRVFLHLLRGLLISTLLFPFYSRTRRRQEIRKWSAALMHILGVQVHVHDAPVRARPLMLVSNHVSWLDIFALNSAIPMRFVAKSEIRRWPFIGWLSAKTGTLFIERRSRRDAQRVVHLVAEALQAGDQIAMFPEGTTSDGHGLLPFHANLLQAAIAVDVPVQAIALRFSDSSEHVSSAAAYIGDMTLMQSMWAVTSASDLTVHVSVLPAFPPQGMARRELAERLRADIVARLERGSDEVVR